MLWVQSNPLKANQLIPLPNACRISAFFPVPDAQQKHFQMLGAIPDESQYPFIDEDVIYLADGSTDYGTQSCLAISSWSLVLATPDMFDPAYVPSGPLPGVIQTNNRAELYKIAGTAAKGYFYTDSQYCCDGFRQLQMRGWVEHVCAQSQNYCLWKKIWLELSDNANRWQIWKVKSHRNISEAKSAHDAWTIFHNDFADSKAKSANRARDPSFWNNDMELMQHYQQESFLCKEPTQLQQRVTEVSKLAKPSTTTQRIAPPQDLWARQLEYLAMMLNDGGISFPSALVMVQLSLSTGL